MTNRTVVPPVPANTATVATSTTYYVALTSGNGQHAYAGNTVTSWQSIVSTLPNCVEVWRIEGVTSMAQAYAAVQGHMAGRSVGNCQRLFG